MRKLVFAAGMLCALVLVIGGTIKAADIDTSEYRKMFGLYGRADGMFQRRDTEGFDLHINGKRLASVGKAVYEDFSEYGDGDDWCMQSDTTGCSGTDTETNLITMPSGNKLACSIIATQTIEGAVDMDAGSLDISGDQTDNDGVECAWGTHGASGGSFTVGYDPAFYTCATLTIADASGTDDLHVGFRVAHDGDTDYGFNKAFDNYHDLAAIGIVGNANPNNIYISTIAADAATSETDTTHNWADAAEHKLCVYVSAAGVTTFTIDDKPPATTATYTFTDAESVVPFIHLVQHGDLTEEVDLTEWEVGYSD